MAPEIVKRTEFDYEMGDVWALGVVLYALISGQFPFKGITNKELYQKIAKGSFTMPTKTNMDSKRLL
jgi:serine/threonine protein kinase